MSEPTLEEIANTPPDRPPYATQLDAVLARELLALRSFLEAFTGIGLTKPPPEVFAFFRKLHGIDEDDLERATPAREDRRPQLAWWVGEVERLKDCVTRAERELDEAGRQVDHVMRSISRVERERDEARERADEGIEMAHAGTRNAIAERDAARASAEKYREALGRIANGADVMYSTEVGVIARRALDGGDS